MPDLRSSPVVLGPGDQPWGIAWVGVPGGIRTETGVASILFEGSIWLFAREEAGGLIFTSMHRAGRWRGWRQVPGDPRTDLLVAAATFDGKLHLFVRTADQRVTHAAMDAHGDWGEWREVPGADATRGALSAVPRGDDLLLFARGEEDRLYVAKVAGSGSWSRWSAVPGELSLAAAPATVAFEKQIFVFGVGDDRRAYFNTLDVGGIWGGWRRVPGTTEARTILIDRAEGPRPYRVPARGMTDTALAAAAADNKLYLFARGIEEGRIVANTMHGGGDWQGWVEVPGGGTTEGQPAAVGSPYQGVFVFRQDSGKGLGFNVTLRRPARWTSIGPTLIKEDLEVPQGSGTRLFRFRATGRLAAVAVHPSNSDIIYAGSPGELGYEGCGVWKTTNGGKSWRPIADDLRIPGGLPTLAIAAVAIDPSTNPERVYVATPDSGIFRSDDAGETWIHPHTGDLGIRRNVRDGDVTFLLIDPQNPKVLYLTSRFGVQRSDDWGATWQVSKSGDATALIMDPFDPGILYAGFRGDGVYRTETGGLPAETGWTGTGAFPGPHNADDVLLATSRPSASTAGTTYALYHTVETPQPAIHHYHLFRTQDGTTWTERWSCEKCSFQTMAADPSIETFVYLAGPLFHMSNNGGGSFKLAPQAPTGSQPHNDFLTASGHGDYKSIVIDPSNPQILYAASDGGIYRSSNRGEDHTWEFIGEGITNAEVYDIALAVTDPTRVIAGTQDNGTILYDGDSVWDHIYPPRIGGDGASVAIAPTEGDHFYFMQQYQNSVVEYSHESKTHLPFARGLPIEQACATYNSGFHLQAHPTIKGLLLAPCADTLYLTVHSTFLPTKWNKRFTRPEPIVRGTFVDGTDLVFAGTHSGRILRATSGATGPVQVFARSSALPVSDLEVDPASRNVYVSFARRPTVERNCHSETLERIVRLTLPDGLSSAASPMVALDLTGNLPGGLCVNSLALDAHDPSILYAGTTRGVYRGRERGTGWRWDPYSHGMPPADVRDLEVHPTTRLLYAATFGRGVFKTVTGFFFLPIADSPTDPAAWPAPE